MNRAPELSADEKATVARIGIHDDEIDPEFRNIDVRDVVNA